MRSRHHSHDGPSLGAIIGLIIAVLVLLVAMASVAYFYLSKDEIDKGTGCKIEHSRLHVASQVVFLVDVTDSMAADVADRLESKIINEVGQLPEGSLIEFYRLDDCIIKISKSNKRFMHCIPRRPETARALTDNERMLKKSFDKFFNAQLYPALQELTSPKESLRSSPICEMIKAVAIEAFSRRDVDVREDRKLIIISDFMHNSPGKYSMYRDGFNFEKFRKSEYGSALLIDSPDLNMRGVEVELWFTKKMTQSNVKFWEKYFKLGYANVTRAERI